MPAGWLFASFFKLVGIVLLCAGIAGAVLPGRTRHRVTAGLQLATLGVLLTWLGGYALLKLTDRPLASPFVLEALFSSLIAVAAAWVASTVARPSPFLLAVPLVGLLNAMGAMVARDAPGEGLALKLGAPLLLGGLGALWLHPQHDPIDHNPAVVSRLTLQWWTWLARAEGSSLLLLMGVVTPAKRLLGWPLDPHGYVGWVHGGLVLLYVASLWPMRRWHGWSAGRLALAFLASLLPFGTFLFERRVLDRDPISPGR
jgi:integral membrane protein